MLTAANLGSSDCVCFLWSWKQHRHVQDLSHKLSLKLILFFSFAHNWFQISFSVCKTAALAFPDGCKWMKFVLLTALLWGQKDNVSFKSGHKGRALNESHLPETHTAKKKPQLRADRSRWSGWQHDSDHLTSEPSSSYESDCNHTKQHWKEKSFKINYASSFHISHGSTSVWLNIKDTLQMHVSELYRIDHNCSFSSFLV